MNGDGRGSITAWGGLVAGVGLLMFVRAGRATSTPSPSSRFEVQLVEPSADPVPTQVLPAAPNDAPTETPAPVLVPCTSDDSIGMHMEIDLSRARGAVSACEWRDPVTALHRSWRYAEPPQPPPYPDLPTPLPAGAGYIVTCVDGYMSKAGGRQGACSHHGGTFDPRLRPAGKAHRRRCGAPSKPARSLRILVNWLPRGSRSGRARCSRNRVRSTPTELRRRLQARRRTTRGQQAPRGFRSPGTPRKFRRTRRSTHPRRAPPGSS